MYVLLLSIVLFAAPQNQVDKNTPANHKQADSSNNTKSKTLPASSTNAPSPKTTPTTHPEQQQRNTDKTIQRIEVVQQTDAWFKGYVIFTAVIAAINFLVLIVIWLQRKEMQSQRDAMRDQVIAMKNQLTEMQTAREQTIEQMKNASAQTGDIVRQGAAQVAALNISANIATKTADAAQRSAKAAELTAQRFTQIEGARIIVKIEWSPTGNLMYGDGSDGMTTGLPIRVTCRNEGKSIGWIREIRLTGEIIPRSIPESPTFEVDVLYHGIQTIAPNGGEFKKEELMTLYGRDDREKWIVLWGMVKYSDIFSDRRETTFGYFVTVDHKIKPITSPAYNRHT